MAGEAARKRTGHTWDDYRQWADDERWELIGGEAFDMSPAPGTSHQAIVLGLSAQLHEQFRNKKCQVFPAPTDVKLSDEDIVQPDVLVVCEPEKIRPTHIEGAPTLVVEVLSPSTEVHDRLRKMALYARAGVKEVWLVSPVARIVEVFVFKGAVYVRAGAYTKGDALRSRAFPKLNVDLNHVFTRPPETEAPARVVREPGPSYRTRPPRPAPTRRRK
jgi:Uma2 family endonuclease